MTIIVRGLSVAGRGSRITSLIQTRIIGPLLRDSVLGGPRRRRIARC